jgi:hypothetical protein
MMKRLAARLVSRAFDRGAPVARQADHAEQTCNARPGGCGSNGAPNSRSHTCNGLAVPAVSSTNERRCREYGPTTNASPNRNVREWKSRTG